jgi:hypothetical protein
MPFCTALLAFLLIGFVPDVGGGDYEGASSDRRLRRGKGAKRLGRNLALRKQREAQSLSSNPDNTVPINHRHITIPQLSAPWAEKCVVLIGTYPSVLHCWHFL